MLYANNAANHHHRRSARRLLACCTRTNGGAHRKLVYYMVGCQLFAHHNNRRKTLWPSGATQISYDVHFNVCVCVIEQSHVDGEIPLRAHVCIISHKSPHWSQLTLYPLPPANARRQIEIRHLMGPGSVECVYVCAALQCSPERQTFLPNTSARFRPHFERNSFGACSSNSFNMSFANEISLR